MAMLRHSFCTAAAALLAACGSGSGSTSDFGIERRVEVAALPLPIGLPQPLPVQLENAFPALLFDRPVLLCAPPDGSNRVVVVEQAGRVRVLPNDRNAASTTVMLDLSAQVLFGGELGLLGLAFHPDYASNGWLYVYYTADLPMRSVLSRFTISADSNVVDAGSEVVLLEVAQPFGNHNSGALAFGPDDKLYVACGDGGSGNDPFDNGQQRSTLLGNILRLEHDGSVPPDNPFVGAAGDVRGEIWAYGLRNPWRMSFDRATGRLWVGDVGQGAREEIDIVVRGGNYGWRIYEGNRENLNPGMLAASSFAAPVFDYDRSQGASVTGGHVYRGAAVPSLQGAYVYGDFASGRIWALVYDGEQAIGNTQITQTNSPASFGEDAAGELFVCCFDGIVRKLTPDATPPPSTALPARLSQTGLFADTAALRAAAGVIEYDVQSPLFSDGAHKRRWLALPGTSRVHFHATEAFSFPIGTALVKHFEIESAEGTTLRLETRVLLHQQSGWTGFSYRWRPDQRDADLVADAGETFSFAVVEQGASVPTVRDWTVPSRASCLSCHTAAAGRVLGVRARQLNRDFSYPLRVDNQLRAWNHIGLFTTGIGDPRQYESFANADDETAALRARARAYLDTNCANCHRPLGPTPVDLDLRFGIAAADMRLFGVSSQSPLPGESGLRAVAGDRQQSELWLRMRRRDGDQMPPLGSHIVDEVGSELVGAWIDSDPRN